LRDEERSDGLVERGAVHVDGGADWHHKARHPGVDSVFLLERRHRNRKGRRAAYQNKFTHPELKKKYANLEAVLKAVASVCAMLAMNLKGRVLVKQT
jgi:hypothetical protein